MLPDHRIEPATSCIPVVAPTDVAHPSKLLGPAIIYRYYILSIQPIIKALIRFRVATLMQKQNSLTFHWLFPDQNQFFTDQNIAVLQPICLLAADKWQIPFTSSLKCTSLILQMKQIKSLNSLLAQNILKLTSFHSFEWAKRARGKKSTFFSHFK